MWNWVTVVEWMTAWRAEHPSCYNFEVAQAVSRHLGFVDVDGHLYVPTVLAILSSSKQTGARG